MAFLLIAFLVASSQVQAPIIEYPSELAINQNALLPIAVLPVKFQILGVKFEEISSETMNTIFLLNLCENSGKWDNTRILDVNGKYSYGGLQFQLETFMRFGKKYEILPDWLTEKEVIKEELIYDRDLQIAIASKMLADGLWYHWKKCLKTISIK